MIKMKLVFLCLIYVTVAFSAPQQQVQTQSASKQAQTQSASKGNQTRSIDLFQQFEKMYQKKVEEKGGEDQITNNDIKDLYRQFEEMYQRSGQTQTKTQIVTKKKTTVNINPFQIKIGDNRQIHYEDDDLTL